MEEVSNSVLLEKLESLRDQIKEFKEAVESKYGDHEKRIRILEDWKLVFVAKFTAYTTIALAVGSFLAQLVIKYIDKFIK